MCSHVCIRPAGARSNHISARNTVHGVAPGPPRPFSLVQYFSRLARGGLRFSDFRLTFASFSSIFRLSLYTHVRTSFLGPVGACVRLCLREAQPADTPSATRARDIRISVL